MRFDPSTELMQIARTLPGQRGKLNKNLNGFDPTFHDDDAREALQTKGPHINERNACHLARLLRHDHNSTQKTPRFPPDVEKRFALAFIKHARRTPRQVLSAIGGEGTGVNQFWTFAPYLHHELTTGGLTPSQSIRTLLAWAEDSLYPNAPLPLGAPLNGLDYRGWNNLELETEKPQSQREAWKTHQLAAQLAQELAPHLAIAYRPESRT